MTRLYFDFTFVLRLVLRTQGSRLANQTLSAFAPPFPLNDLLVLQVENFLSQTALREPRSGNMVSQGRALWHRELSEMVFQVTPVDWSAACRAAMALNREAGAWPGTPLAVLHVAAAAQTSATHFFSFDTRQRALAARRGFAVLPDVTS